jgi:DHA2 family multidrug resistance protein-like MFS transporter
MTAMRQVGATIGVAVLGTVLSSVYRGRLALTGLPADLVAAARSSVGTGVAVALRLRSPQLLTAVHAAYAGGVDVMLWVCAGIAIAAAVLAALFLPRHLSGTVQPTGTVQPAGTAQATPAGVADAELGAARAE